MYSLLRSKSTLQKLCFVHVFVSSFGLDRTLQGFHSLVKQHGFLPCLSKSGTQKKILTARRPKKRNGKRPSRAKSCSSHHWEDATIRRQFPAQGGCKHDLQKETLAQEQDRSPNQGAPKFCDDGMNARGYKETLQPRFFSTRHVSGEKFFNRVCMHGANQCTRASFECSV